MIQPDVPVMLLDPGLNGTLGSINVDLTTFAGNAVDTSYFKAKVIAVYFSVLAVSVFV